MDPIRIRRALAAAGALLAVVACAGEDYIVVFCP